MTGSPAAENPAARESWEPATTADNLKLIREARERRNDTVPWSAAIEEALARRAARLRSGSARGGQD